MKDVIILGRADSWVDCPFDTEVWAICSCLDDPEFREKRIDKVFIFDPPEEASVIRSVGIARSLGIPVVSNKKTIADERFPTQEIIYEFGIEYFRNSASFMIALAIYQGYEKIRLYGIDQFPQWDYLANKPYVTFWLGVAVGRGIKIEVAPTSPLMVPIVGEYQKIVERVAASNQVLPYARVLYSFPEERIRGDL